MRGPLQKYHHPDCKTNPPEDSPQPTCVGDCWRNPQVKQHTKCDGCKPLWPAFNRAISSFFHVVICTDGSTFKPKPSGAAFVFVEDDILDKDLWNIQGF